MNACSVVGGLATSTALWQVSTSIGGAGDVGEVGNADAVTGVGVTDGVLLFAVGPVAAFWIAPMAITTTIVSIKSIPIIFRPK